MYTTAYALVDYFNVARLPGHRPATYADHADALEELVGLLLGAATALQPRPGFLKIRLYGGWHDERTNRTTDAREMLGAIARRHYPTLRPLRVFVSLADSLIALPRYELRHTLRLWNGIGRPRTRRHGACAYPDTCPLGDLREWARGSCPKRPDCSVKTREAVLTERQKLVDTSMVADTMHLARHTSTDWIAVVSNDDDILPGLLAAAADNQQLLLYTVERSQPSQYGPLLDHLEVKYQPLSRSYTR
ncbi:MAG: hypothetical protein F4060_09235 [Holophagales bacterium]|nr:hypothetical protein [Holophagales bacterium]MYG29368.1 hypothetical protein [Holophagales bacterium]MYI80114.1 hypothetical protein [Holophagales bacterium]